MKTNKKQKNSNSLQNILGIFPPPEPHFSIILELITASPKEGVFRVPGSKNEVDDILSYLFQHRNDTNEKAIRQYLSSFQVHTLCSTLKSYLASVSLMCANDEDWDLLQDSLESKDLGRLRNYIETRIAFDRRKILYRILELIEVLVSVPETKMNTSNMSVVFAPSLTDFKSKDDEGLEPTAALIKHQRHLSISVPMVTTLLNERDFLFQSLKASNKSRSLSSTGTSSISRPENKKIISNEEPQNRSSNIPSQHPQKPSIQEPSILDSTIDKSEQSDENINEERIEDQNESELENDLDGEKFTYSDDKEDNSEDKLRSPSFIEKPLDDERSFEDEGSFSITHEPIQQSFEFPNDNILTPRSTISSLSGHELVQNSLKVGTNSPISPNSKIVLTKPDRKHYQSSPIVKLLPKESNIENNNSDPYKPNDKQIEIEKSEPSTIRNKIESPISQDEIEQIKSEQKNLKQKNSWYDNEETLNIKASDFRVVVKSVIKKEISELCTNWDKEISDLKYQLANQDQERNKPSIDRLEIDQMKKEIENILSHFSHYDSVLKRIEASQESLSLRIEEVSKLNRSSNHSSSIALEHMRNEMKENNLTIRELSLQIDALKLTVKSISTPKTSLPESFERDPQLPQFEQEKNIQYPIRSPPNPPTDNIINDNTYDNVSISENNLSTPNQFKSNYDNSLFKSSTSNNTTLYKSLNNDVRSSLPNTKLDSSELEHSTTRSPRTATTRSPITHAKLTQQLELLQKKYLGGDRRISSSSILNSRNPYITDNRYSNIYSNLTSRRTSFLDSYYNNPLTKSPVQAVERPTYPETNLGYSKPRSPSSYTSNINQKVSKSLGGAGSELESSIQNLRRKLNFE